MLVVPFIGGSNVFDCKVFRITNDDPVVDGSGGGVTVDGVLFVADGFVVVNSFDSGFVVFGSFGGGRVIGGFVGVFVKVGGTVHEIVVVGDFTGFFVNVNGTVCANVVVRGLGVDFVSW